ncbi:GNAT family N-acetyltransferase [Colwellia sp. RSH04]|uniref:GNAT family N-acetyltransferase n=1 Tax=Colwellia sp. RSH04 TaxID=2305464 RepID=UPI000E5959CE|nr:GNAT family protein [Colwellia sp. RSH04]RHW75965.1 N-acetyltransferase [Colwellia sp. RSH04]
MFNKKVSKNLRINTQRFYLRELTEKDVGPRYLSWLQDNITSKFITYRQDNINDLKAYVRAHLLASEVLFLGVFCKETDEHIGNLKFDNINNGQAVMGILIGEPDWRGRGVAKEILPASMDYLHNKRKVDLVYLGVGKKNIPAILAYEEVGFISCNSPPFPIGENGIAMIYQFE